MKPMKLCWEPDDDKYEKLLTQIRRSYWRINERLTSMNEVETKLFKFKQEDHDEFNEHRVTKRILNRVFSVIQKSTGKKYFVSMYISFGKADWSLWQEE